MSLPTRHVSLIALMTVLLAALGPVIIVPAQGPRAPVPTLTIAPMSPASRTADITATNTYAATFTTTVTVDKMPLIGTVNVQLEASTSTGWTTAVSPQTIPFTSPGSVQVQVSVVVPAGALAGITGIMTLNGLATYPLGSAAASSSATILVGQYYGCSINATPRSGGGNPQTFTIKVHNNGNGNDSYELSILASEALSKAGLSVSIDTIKTDKLAVGENATVKVKVSYGPSAGSGKHTFYVRAVSVGSKTAGNDSVFSDVLLTIDVSPFSGQAGQTVGLVAGAIIVSVIVVLFIAKKKGKLHRRPKGSKKAEASKTEKKDSKEK